MLVFGNHPCSGDWFGGLRADDAEAFIAALTEMECVPVHLLLFGCKQGIWRACRLIWRCQCCRVGSDGGPSDPSLKKWWRGRMGMEKEDQQRFFDCGCLPDDPPEDDVDLGKAALARSSAMG